MSHNKMYRQIDGYEEGMSLACDVKDEMDEVLHSIRYGESVDEVIKGIVSAKSKIAELERVILLGRGRRLSEEEM